VVAEEAPALCVRTEVAWGQCVAFGEGSPSDFRLRAYLYGDSKQIELWFVRGSDLDAADRMKLLLEIAGGDASESEAPTIQVEGAPELTSVTARQVDRIATAGSGESPQADPDQPVG
jgi:hypothetical protein